MRKLKIDIAGALVLVNWSLATVLHHPPLAPRIVVARAHISSVLCKYVTPITVELHFSTQEDEDSGRN